jgi:hypothetical protein
MNRPYEEQQKATRAALHLLTRLPLALRWALSVTNEDDPSSPSTLNIFTEGSADWDYIIRRLALTGKPDKGQGFISYYGQSLMVSLVNVEEEND